MDTSNALTEPYVQFLERYNAINHQFKASLTAIQYVSEVLNDRPQLVEEFLATMDRRWRDGHNWTTTPAVLKRAAVDTCQLAVVQIHSALDDFEVHVRAALAQWEEVSGIKAPRSEVPNAPYGDDEPLWKLCKEVGLPAGNLVAWRPLLATFRVMRHCIVHAGGRASRHLEELAKSKALEKVLASWPKRKHGRAPPAPTVVVGKAIQIPAKGVILCLDSAYRACSYMNESIRQVLGAGGMSYAAAHYCLLDKDRIYLDTSHRTAYRAINYTLAIRYNVLHPRDESSNELRKLGCLERCERRHRDLYWASVRANRFALPHGFAGP